MKMIAIAGGLVLLVSSSLARGATLTMGNPGIADGDTGYGAGTLIDMNNPANATGSLTTATIAWVNHPCSPAGKIKVFHRTGNTLSLAGEQAFDIPASGGPGFSVALAPPLPVHQGDLLGVYNPGTCNGPKVNTTPFSGLFLVDSHDVTTLTFDPSADLHNGGVALSGSGTITEFRVGVVAGVGSGPGSNGSHFLTSLQLVGLPFGGDISGKLVFHRAGVGGSASDPFLPFTVPEGRAIQFPDIVSAMGQTGFGTIDLVLPAGSTAPVAIARVYNQDPNTGGTTGLGEDLVATADGVPGLTNRIIPAGFTGFVSAPPNTENTRFNIGVRTLDSGASVTYVLKDQFGTTVATHSEIYPPNYFNQVDAAAMFGVSSISENAIVVVTVSLGSAIVYGASTDDTTNDPSAQFVIPLFGIA